MARTSAQSVCRFQNAEDVLQRLIDQFSVSKDGVLPDLFITCASFNFLVHEKVVVEKCEFFRGAMTVPMKVCDIVATYHCRDSR